MRNLKRFNENFNNRHSMDEMNNVWRKLNTLATNNGDDVIWDLMEMAFERGRISIEDFVNKLPGDLGYDYEYLVSVLKQIKEEGI
jgi:hypothetical protein